MELIKLLKSIKAEKNDMIIFKDDYIYITSNLTSNWLSFKGYTPTGLTGVANLATVKKLKSIAAISKMITNLQDAHIYLINDFNNKLSESVTTELITTCIPIFNSLKKCAGFSAKKDARAFLNGVYIDKKENFMAATDAHRLIKTELFNDYHDSTGDNNALIKNEVIDFILKNKLERCTIRFILCKDIKTQKEYGYYSIDDKYFFYSRDNILEYRYPAVDRVIPLNNDKKIVINKAKLKAIKPLVTCKLNTVTLSNKMVMTPHETKRGESIDFEGVILSNELSGPISFNINYLIDLLQLDDKENITITGYDNQRSITYRPDHTTTVVVMPLRA